ncbi:sterigmatocystin biosynthesis lipase esterase STCI [Fusarium beomiforme]|uniref:Sterigmatocystin biosynthesis lipase esterase STCI n=1 Tax=Fusarium beomiforme TaxID=44412 RepID=A0A9P5AGI8_9HYPO|nr:sterigmatocystin biosynthesis lipase esterase STCI [Fusarium beomiforme]
MTDYTASWLKVEESLGGTRPVLSGTAEELREQFAGLGAFLATLSPPPSEHVVVQDGEVGGIAYRKYIPRHSKAQNPRVGVFYHSGGFVVGGLDSEDAFCRNVALQNDMIVVSVDYRLAPEHKAPAQLEDALALLEWVSLAMNLIILLRNSNLSSLKAYDNAVGNGARPSKFVVIGTSAGGALALAVTRKVVLGSSSLPKSAIDGVITLCPMTLHPDHVPAAYRAEYTSYEENKENVPVINKQAMLQFFDYAGVDPIDKNTFPLLDETALKLFPRTYVVTAEKDPLRDDGKVLVKTLSSLGVNCKTDHYGGLPHCFWIFPPLPETKVFMSNVGSAVSWIVG